MKKLLVIILLIASVPLFGQNQNVRQTVSGTNVIFYRGATQLDPVNTDYATTVNPVFSGVVKLAPNDTLATKAYARGYAGGGGEGSLGWFNIKAYKTLTDGSDDQPEIQAALDAGAGGTVYFPKGTYSVSATLVVSSGTIIKGDGWENTKIKARTDWATEGRGIFSFQSNAQNIRFEGIQIDGNNAAFKAIPTKDKQIYGISTYNGSHTNASYITIKDVEIKKTSAFATYSKGVQWHFENCWIHACGDTIHHAGLYVSGTRGFSVNNCRIDSCYEHGIYFGEGSDVRITNSTFNHNGLIADVIAGEYGSGISMRADSNVVITGNTMMYNSGFGLSVMRASNTEDDIKNVVVTGNTISENEGYEGTAGRGTQVKMLRATRVMFANNNIGPTGGNKAVEVGIDMWSRNSNVAIQNNNIYTNYALMIGGDSTQNIYIKGNNFGSPGFSGVVAMYIDANWTAATGRNLSITNNDIEDFVTGIRLLSTFDIGYTTIKNNNYNYGVDYRVTNESSATNHNIEYKGSSAFTTTADRKAIFIDGLTTDYDATVTADQGSDAVHPVAADLMSAYCKADSLIVKRVAGTGGTSGLKFKYLVNND